MAPRKAKTLRELEIEKENRNEEMFSTADMHLDDKRRASLQRFYERIVSLENDREETSREISAVYAEAQSEHFDKGALKEAIRLARKDADERETARALTDLYLDALATAGGAREAAA
jgi:uncharacterized protein (UPF0335 family)